MRSQDAEAVRLFLCGDVMLGRGIDQILPHPSDPRLFEEYVHDASAYVAMAERRQGAMPRGVGFDYVWGDALAELEQRTPWLRLVNLETAVTTSDAPWSGKGIHYRMQPANLPCLAAAGINCCALANNHVLDWGYAGLRETLASLHGAGIATVGAGEDDEAAARPAVFPLCSGGRLLVFAFGARDSGIPETWTASPGHAGVNLLPDFTITTVECIARRIDAIRRLGDLVVASIHWGDNWGYAVAREHRRFAHALIDHAGVDLLHGHSSHHPRPLEVHRERLILYGCGDFINDYEGISGYEVFRSDLCLAYWPELDPRDGRLLALAMTPLQIRQFRLRRACPTDAEWLATRLRKASQPFGAETQLASDGALEMHWR